MELGSLMSGMSGGAQAPPAGMMPPPQERGEEEVLGDLAELLQEYLAMGSDTPVAQEAQNLLDTISGGGEEAVEPEADPEAEEIPEESDGYEGSNYSEATDGAKDFLKKKNKDKAA